MKKYKQLQCIFLCYVIQAASSSQLNAQAQPVYSQDVERNIRQVEQNLAGWVQTQDPSKWSIKERMAHYRVHGLSIAVVHNYKIEWAKGYGWADSADQRPVTTKTDFQAASISKSLNAVGVLKLAQDKRLDLYADINNYLRTWKFPYDSLSKNKKICLANLLSHTAGLSVHGFPGYEIGDSIPTIVQILDGRRPANTAAVRSMFEPGLKLEYSGGGTTISQLIIMDITKQPYDLYMWENVLKPMGMTGSFYTQPPPDNKRSVLATAYKENGTAIKGKYHIYPEEAPAGLWTNPTDLSKYIIETQLSYEGKSAKVLSEQMTKLRLTPCVDSAVGLGVFRETRGDTKYFQHGGANEGFRCQYFGSLKGGNGVVVMVNSDNGRILSEVINSVAIVYEWKDFYHPTIKKTVKLSPELLKSYDGKYRFQFRKGEDVFIQIKSTERGLALTQLWDGQEMDFVAESDLEFFTTDEPFRLKFIRDAAGSITQMLADNRDMWDKVKE